MISSLLVVLFVEAYLRLRIRCHKRSLRAALGKARSATVVASVFPSKVGPNSVSLMGTHDAYAMSHILTAYRKIGVHPAIVSVLSLPDGLDDNVVCIGGPYVNALTEAHLSLFCPRFEQFSPVGEESFNPIGRRAGSCEFVESKEQAWGFIAKLSPGLTGRRFTTILVWGLGAIGTSAAAYFLSELHHLLPTRSGQSFIVAIPVQRAIGYRGVSTAIRDISDEVWPAPDESAAADPVSPARLQSR